ncbi:OLC1v1024719C1 [Oldenlandia corymbosa var. corymbosa]|uniref:OLC1v1024719C1 n=1 Tax=Oldenlandia corymbosa var. corymbosa TaxID=529605 RepID=A0AAV1C3X6_OLDCO|nr:OLC1v1024719C1 [Oldenlandia corymbosa var. corymbosa]
MVIQSDLIVAMITSNYDVVLPLLLSALTIAFFLSGRYPGRKDDVIPGRLGIPFFGETLSFLSATNSDKGCYDFVTQRRSWYGRWFKTRIFGKIHVFVPSVEGAKTVFTNDFTIFNKGYVKSMADTVGNKSLLTSPHESHKRIRRLLSDPFSMSSLSKFVQKIDRMLCQRLTTLETNGQSFMVLHFSMKLTFDAMCDMLMSVTDDSLLRQIERDCTAVSDAMLSFPVMIPGTRYYKGIKARQRLMETFRDMITLRRTGNANINPDDFLGSMLKRDSYPDDEKLSDQEIMDNLLTLIIAGQTTTAAAMMWSVKFLSDNPQVLDKLREEQLSILRRKPTGALLTLEDLNSMPYASQVVKETLRMSNVLLWFPRVVADDCKIQGKWTVDDPDPRLERKAHIPRLRSGCPITLIALHDVK